MSQNVYVLFGYNVTNKLETLKNSKLFDFESVSFKDFPSLNSFTSCNIKELFLGWSFLLLKTNKNLFFSGHQISSNKQQVVKIFLNKSNFCEVTCGMSISFIALQNKKLYYFSNSKFETIPINLKDEMTEIKSIDTEDLYTVLLTQDNKVFDVKMSDISVNQLNLNIPIKMVACGKEHVLLLTTTGVILSYGIGSRGQLGHGNIDKLNQPVVIEALDGLEIKTIAAGGWHSAAISCFGDLYMWGWNESGQIGLPCSQISSSTSLSEVYTVCCFPKIIELENLKVLTVSCGSRHTAAITEDKTVWTWGWNEYGQLGHSICLLSDKPEKIKMPDNYIPQSIKCKFWNTIITGYIK